MATTRLLSTSEVAARLGVTRQTIQRRIEAGQITPSGVLRGGTGKRPTYIFTPEDVEQLAAMRASALAAEIDALAIDQAAEAIR